MRNLRRNHERWIFPDVTESPPTLTRINLTISAAASVQKDQEVNVSPPTTLVQNLLTGDYNLRGRRSGFRGYNSRLCVVATQEKL